MLRQQLAVLRDEKFDLKVLGFDETELAQRLEAEDRAGFQRRTRFWIPERSRHNVW